MKSKKSKIRVLKNDITILKHSLSFSMHHIDFLHITTLFLVKNDKSIKRSDNIQKQKLERLVSNVSSVEGHDPDKVIFNFSSYGLSASVKALLSKGLNFAIPPEKLEYSSFLLPFELLMRDLKSENLTQQELKSVKARLQDTALSSFENYNNNLCPKNLSDKEIKTLKLLLQQKDLVIKKSQTRERDVFEHSSTV